MMLAQVFTIMFWSGAAFMAGGAFILALSLIGAIIAIAFGWEVRPWQ